MDGSWVKAIVASAVALIAVGAAYGTMRGRMRHLETRLQDQHEQYTDKLTNLTKRLDKHSSELDELRDIHITVGKLEVKMDHLLELIKELKNEK